MYNSREEYDSHSPSATSSVGSCQILNHIAEELTSKTTKYSQYKSQFHGPFILTRELCIFLVLPESL